MQIQLKQEELDKVITDYLQKQLSFHEGTVVTIEYATTRVPTKGITATININDGFAAAAPTEAKESEVNSQPSDESPSEESDPLFS